jgi:hypothetical protein
MLNAGLRLEVLQQLLGHLTIDITLQYARISNVTREDKEQIAERLIFRAANDTAALSEQTLSFAYILLIFNRYTNGTALTCCCPDLVTWLPSRRATTRGEYSVCSFSSMGLVLRFSTGVLDAINRAGTRAGPFSKASLTISAYFSPLASLGEMSRIDDPGRHRYST